jgi:Lysozyme like domain
VTVYTYAQLEQLWINNGGSTATAPLAAAIAEAESSGNSTATSANPDGGTNVGLWQLDTNGKGSGLTVAQLQDPNVNAAAAVTGSSGGTDWSAWETYVNGAYTQFLSNSTPPSSAGVPASTAAASTAAAVTVVPGTCVVPYPTLNLVVTTVGGGCILSKSEARAVIGGFCLAAGGLIILPGLIVLVAAGFRATGAASALSAAAGPLARVPGYGRVLAAA